MRDMHESWQKAVEATDRVQAILGGSIRDAESGRTWDPGQAICRELYGPDWVDNPQFLEMSAAEVCPTEYFEAADRLCRKEPTWLQS